MKDNGAYGERIRAYRMRRKISQEELAEQVGLPETALSRIEHGARKVTLEEAVRLAEVLRISLTQLAGVEEMTLADETHAAVSYCTKKGQRVLTELASVFQELDSLVAH